MGQLVLFHLCPLSRLHLLLFFYPELKLNRSYTLLDMAPPVLRHLMDPQKKKHPETAPELDFDDSYCMSYTILCCNTVTTFCHIIFKMG